MVATTLFAVFLELQREGSAPNTQDCGELILAILMIVTTICGVYLALEREGPAPSFNSFLPLWSGFNGVFSARPMRSTPIRRFLSECVCMCVFVWLGNSAKLTYVSFLRRITFWHILIFKLWQVTCVPLRGERFVAAAEESAWPAPKCRPRP